MAGESMSANEMVSQWDAANARWIQGTRYLSELLIGPASAEAPSWGDGLPADLNLAPDPPALLGALRLGGYLAYDRTGLSGVSGAEDSRASLLLDACGVPPSEVRDGLGYVRQGGALLAFGRASLAGDEYALAEVFGAQYGGLVQFDTEASRVTLTADTTYAPQFSPPNVIDGRADTFWASIEAGPMPHWVQLDFAQPRTAAGAQVSCRPGFLLKDLEVQAKVGEEWQTLASVADNTGWDIDCPFEGPVEAQSFRLLITREELNGENRVIADVGEFTLLDDRGSRLIPPPYLIEGRLLDEAWARANRSDRLLLRSPAVRLKPTTAKVLATFPDPLTGEPLPLCTINKVGEGRAYLFAIPEAAFGYAPETWEALLRPLIGLPMVRHSGDENVLAFLRRGKGRAILHLVDAAPVESDERAREAFVRVDTQALGKVKAARLLPEDRPIETRPGQGFAQFTMPVNPMGTVLLELAK